MRSVGQLLRSAARCAAGQVGCQPALAGADAASTSGRPLRSLAALLAAQRQQAAGFAAGRRQDELEEELEGGEHTKLHHRPSHAQLFKRVNREIEEAAAAEGEGGGDARRRIHALLEEQAGTPGAAGAEQFVDSFFGEEYKGEDYVYGAAASDEEEGGSEDEEEWEEDEMEVSTGQALSEAEEFNLMSKLGGLRKGAQRSVLQKLLQGGILEADPEAMQEWQEIQRQFQPPEDFRMKVVDVNYTCKGTKSGGLYRYSCMVVVGNGEGVLGWGQGKAAETADAVQKAYMRACRNLFPIPRYNDHTIPEPMQAKFGKVKIVMYPKAAGNGIKSNDLIYDICKMAGLHDVGIKVYGSRNPRSTVKCLFEAFDKLRTHEEMLERTDKVVLPMPTGRYGRLRLKA